MISTAEEKLRLSTTIACLGLICAILLSSGLWSSDRLFGLSPIVSSLAEVPSSINYFLVLFMVAVLAVSIRIQETYTLVPPLICLGFFVLQDLLRFQPYIYMYAFMLCVAVYVSLNGNKENAINALRIMVVGIYFWAGAQKINYSFYDSTLPWFMSGIFPSELLENKLVTYSMYLVPFLEVAVAIFFLWSATVWLGFVLATGMLVFVLLCLGPLGWNWNSVVWPWNIALYLLDIVLFKNAKISAKNILIPRSAIHASALLLFLILPILSYFGKWHAYPSFQLYSGNAKSAYLEVPENVLKAFPVLGSVVYDGEIWLQDWSIEEMNVVTYPEEFIFFSSVKTLCEKVEESDRDNIVLTIHGRPHWRTGQHSIDKYTPCEVNR